MLETQRLLYNRALEERRDVWGQEERSVTYQDQCKRLTIERVGHEYLSRCHSQMCQATLKRLDRAFQNFFRRVKAGQKAGYPRFKAYGSLDSLEFPQCPRGCGLNDKTGRLSVFGIGQIKIKLHRAIEGEVKIATIKREADQWFVVFSCKVPDPTLAPSMLSPVGIDLGLNSFFVTSDGDALEPPRHFCKAEKKLAKLQKRLSRKKKGSRNRDKARVKVARVHRKIANQRADFHHKKALDLVRNHGAIAHEKLNVKGICRTRLAKSTHDAGWRSSCVSWSAKR